MGIEFHPQATAEVEQSAKWYAERSLSAAAGFATALKAALHSIENSPSRFLEVRRGILACSLVGYPYQVIYRLDPPRIQVVAVAHAKRCPGYWKRRR